MNPNVNITNFQPKMVQIDHSQTTFLVLKVENQCFQIDFLDKKAFKLKNGMLGRFEYFENHPLLMDYNENWLSTYINSKPENVECFINDFKHVINEMTEGWRHWTHYVANKRARFTEDTFVNNVKQGHGQLFNAPFNLTQKLLDLCAKHNISTKTFGKAFQSNDYKLILIGDNYVIAKAFQVSSVT